MNWMLNTLAELYYTPYILTPSQNRRYVLNCQQVKKQCPENLTKIITIFLLANV